MKSEYEDMNPHAKALWLQELRSGAYKQITEALSDYSDGYCASGLLCLAYTKATKGRVDWGSYRIPRKVREWAGLRSYACWIGTPTNADYDGRPSLGAFDFRMAPDEIRQHISFHKMDNDPLYAEYNYEYFFNDARVWRTIYEWNDVWKLSFSEIANLVEFGVVDSQRLASQ